MASPTSARQLFLWPVILGYGIAMSTLHLELSLWLVGRWEIPGLGTVRPADFVPVAALLLGAALVAVVARQGARGQRRRAFLALWALWAALVLLVDLALVFSVNEYFHYPQYALLAWLLARALDPGRARWPIGAVLLLATLFGIADETLQYTHETVSYSEYLDFNDFLLNLLGAAAGVLLYYGFRAGPARARTGRWAGAVGFLVLAGVLAAGAAGLRAGVDPAEAPAEDLAAVPGEGGAPRWPGIERVPARYGHWLAAPHRGRYYVLDPWTGSVLLGLVGIAFSVAVGPSGGRRGRGRSAGEAG